jgi:hypothetical protein
VDRDIVLVTINANPDLQFEFVQAQWINDGDFTSQGDRSDPLNGGQSALPCGSPWPWLDNVSHDKFPSGTLVPATGLST